MMNKLLLLTLHLEACLAWRGKVEPRPSHEVAISSFFDTSEGQGELEETSSTGLSKVVCTGRLPVFGNRLCLEVKTHTDDLVNFITAENSSDAMDAMANPIRTLPDLTMDFAWMGCSTSPPAMRVCSPGQTCRKDPDGPLSFPWRRVVILSLKSLVAGKCFSLTQLLMTPAVSILLMPLLKEYAGAMAPYLGGMLGYTYSRLLDELLLGRYCIYLTTHVAGEVISGKTLTQDMRCIDHLYKIHIPGLFGLIPSKELSNPESSLVCWPTAEALSKEDLVKSMEAMTEVDEDEEEEEQEDLKIPTIPSPELLSTDKVCRSGATDTFCTACETVSQAATWRMQRLREVAQAAGLQNAGDELGAVESRMLIHANSFEQCRGDDDPKCLDDYSLCVLKPGLEDAKECNGQTAYWPEKEKDVCSNWCTSSCGASTFHSQAYCTVSEEHLGRECRVNRAMPYRFDVVKKGKLGGAWVHCGKGPTAMYNIHWQHRLLKIVAMRKLEGTTVEDREHAARQVMQIFAEPTVTATNVTMLDVMVLRLSQLVGTAKNFKEASAAVCREAACCA